MGSRPHRLPTLALTGALAAGLAGAARARIKPATSGKLSHREPELCGHGSGLTHPNVPHRGSRRVPR